MEYKISLDYDDYFSNSQIIKATNLEVVGEAIMFATDKKTLLLLDSKNISYMLHDSKMKRIKNIFKYKTGIYVGLLWVLLLIVMNSFRVNRIEFNGDYPINEEITSYINNQNQQILFFSFHKNNYQDLSKNLRSTFYEYEWINVSKKGSTIYVTINTPQEFEQVIENNEMGDIVAKKSGMISEYKVFSGLSLVESNQYVKKGEVLVEGQASGAKGYVLATVYEEIKVTVMKEKSVATLTGVSQKYTSVKLFKKSFNVGKKATFSQSDTTIKKIFNIPGLLSINKIEELEKNDIIYTYDSDKAKEIAQNIITEGFTNSKVLNEERIVRIEQLYLQENSDSFEIVFLVKKIESIGEFKKRV